MSEWRVDPGGVLGVLAGVDDLGPGFERAVSASYAFTAAGSSVFAVAGRGTVLDAWMAFMDHRQLLPGEVMYAVAGAARAVGDATVQVVAGSEDMTANFGAARGRAEDAWGIAPPLAYASDHSGDDRW